MSDEINNNNGENKGRNMADTFKPGITAGLVPPKSAIPSVKITTGKKGK